MSNRGNTRRYPRGAWLWGPAVGFVALGALALWQVPAWLLQHWLPASTTTEQAKLLGTAAQIVLLALGGVIAVIGVALSLARHGQALQAAAIDRQRADQDRENEVIRRAEVDGQREFEERREAARQGETAVQRLAEQERELRSRFTVAVDLLSAAVAIKRTAGLYALAALADDWLAAGRAGEVQVCVDVLCGYLRSEAPTDAGERSREREVRRTGFDLIREHLRTPDDDAEVPTWAGVKFILRRAPIWFDVDLSGIVCADTTEVDLSECLLEDDASLSFYLTVVSDTGSISLRAARLSGHSSVRLNRVKVSKGFLECGEILLADYATLVFEQLEVSDGGILGLNWAQVSDQSRVILDGCVVESDGLITGTHIALRGRPLVSFAGATVNAGEVRLGHTTITEDARLSFSGAQVRGAHLILNDLLIAERGVLRLDKTQLSAQSTTLSGTTLRGGSITIGGARLDPKSVSLPNGQWADSPVGALPPESYVKPDRILMKVGAQGASQD